MPRKRRGPRGVYRPMQITLDAWKDQRGSEEFEVSNLLFERRYDTMAYITAISGTAAVTGTTRVMSTGFSMNAQSSPVSIAGEEPIQLGGVMVDTSDAVDGAMVLILAWGGNGTTFTKSSIRSIFNSSAVGNRLSNAVERLKLTTLALSGDGRMHNVFEIFTDSQEVTEVPSLYADIELMLIATTCDHNLTIRSSDVWASVTRFGIVAGDGTVVNNSVLSQGKLHDDIQMKAVLGTASSTLGSALVEPNDNQYEVIANDILSTSGLGDDGGITTSDVIDAYIVSNGLNYGATLTSAYSGSEDYWRYRPAAVYLRSVSG